MLVLLAWSPLVWLVAMKVSPLLAAMFLVYLALLTRAE